MMRIPPVRAVETVDGVEIAARNNSLIGPGRSSGLRRNRVTVDAPWTYAEFAEVQDADRRAEV